MLRCEVCHKMPVYFPLHSLQPSLFWASLGSAFLLGHEVDLIKVTAELDAADAQALFYLIITPDCSSLQDLRRCLRQEVGHSF